MNPSLVTVWFIVLSPVFCGPVSDRMRDEGRTSLAQSMNNNRVELLLNIMNAMVEDTKEMMMEKKEKEHSEKKSREGREFEDLEDLDDLEGEGTDQEREGKQTRLDRLETCEKTGEEVVTEEECEEVSEIECKFVDKTQYRNEIVTRCETRIDKDCNVTMTEVPEQKCEERKRKR